MTQSPHQLEVAPSILASNFLNLGDAVATAEAGAADRLHIDVMDGRFVPNITVGQPIVQCIRSASQLVLETHLMIVEPERYVESFSEAGADLITVHQEVSPHLYRTLQHIQRCGKKAGVAINPGTSWTLIEEVLDLADLVLVMTVNPGFGGQEFIEGMLSKVARVREELDRRGLTARLEVDGGVDVETVPRLVKAGADTLVAGTAIFRSTQTVPEAIVALKTAAGALERESLRRRDASSGQSEPHE